MGRDIHMHILNDKGECIKEDIYPNRNSEWFRNISGKSEQIEYDFYPVHFGIPSLPDLPDWYKKDSILKSSYYDFCYIKVEDFLFWFNKYKPHKKAGWVSTYTKWLYETKDIYPQNYYCYKDQLGNDQLDTHFIEFEDSNDPALLLEKFLERNKIALTSYIVYYFDC